MTDATCGERHRRWIGAWGAEVRDSPVALGLFEYPSTRLVEVSRRAAELLGRSPEAARGLDFLDITDRPEDTAVIFRMMSDGRVQSIEALRPFPQVDGTVIEAHSCGRAVRSGPGADLGIWVILESAADRDVASVIGERAIGPAPLPALVQRVTSRLVLVPTDGGWRVASAEAGAETLLGRRPGELVGLGLGDLFLLQHIGPALLAIAQATTQEHGIETLDVQHADGGLRPVTATFTMHGRGAEPRFEVALVALDAAAELPAIQALPTRQREVVTRLVRGERVKTIAAEMYLSEPTVRNHLTVVFRKFGVHSQDELLTLLRQRRSAEPASAPGRRCVSPMTAATAIRYR